MNVFYLGMKLQTDEGMMNYMEKFILDNIDLSVEEGLKVLASADMRIGKDGGSIEWPQIYYKDEWWVICRTDLTDNVGTGRYMGSNLDETRNNLAKHIRYGVRLHTHEDGRKSFLCVDSWSDG